MKRLTLMIFLLLILATNSFAKEYKISTWWRLNGENYREEGINSRGDNTSFILSIKLKKLIGDWAEVRVSPGFKFATGSGQGLIHDDRPRNSLFANEAIFKTNHHIFEFTAGSINQRHVYARSVVSNLISFPGLMGELFIFKERTFSFSTRGQVAIPSAYTFATDSTATETSPRFYTASVDFNGRVTDFLEAHLVASYFSYQGLPQIVAVRSATEGNSVTLTSSTTGAFDYGFQGYSFHSDIGFSITDQFKLISNFEWAINNKALEGRDSSNTTRTGFELGLDNNRTLRVMGSYMRRDSDVGPGILNFGSVYNNRVGYGLRVSLNFRKEKMRFIAGYEQSDPIFVSSIMAQRKVGFLRMESSDDIL